jgi:hypothetical protein
MCKRGLTLTLVAAALLVFVSLVQRGGSQPDALAAEQAAHQLRSFVMSAAGAPGGSTGFKANGTLGQPTPIGIGTSATRIMYAGFWGRFWALTPVDKPPVFYRNALLQNYPNPFNPMTTIDYTIASACPVEVAIFNVEGQKIRTLLSEVKVAGAHRTIWDGRNDKGASVASGIYFYRLRAGSYSSVKKMLLLR